jgi:phospholipid/cholesterol/gamma-HCH transport system substrate-binding protein
MRHLRRRPRRAVSLAAVVAITVAVTGCGISLQSLPKLGGISGPTYNVKATFANVVNLPANAEVREGAYQVGYVSNIATKNFAAVVTMTIKKSIVLPASTTVEVRFDTPLGEDFLLLQPPTGAPAQAARLTNGSAIAEAQTSTAPSVEDTFGALGALLNGGGLNQLQTIITETNNVLVGNQPQIRSLLNQLNTTLTSFNGNSGAIDSALTAIGDLSQVLNRSSGAISNGIGALGPAVGVLASENTQLNQLISQVGRLSTVANNIVTQTQVGTVQDLQALGPVLNQLTAVQQQLSPALTAIDRFEQVVPQVTPGGYLQASIHATIQVPAAGTAPVHKITVDPPDPAQAYNRSSLSVIFEASMA